MIPAFFPENPLRRGFHANKQIGKLHSLALQAVRKGFRFVIDIIVILRVGREKERPLVGGKLPVAELFELSG